MLLAAAARAEPKACLIKLLLGFLVKRLQVQGDVHAIVIDLGNEVVSDLAGLLAHDVVKTSDLLVSSRLRKGGKGTNDLVM